MMFFGGCTLFALAEKVLLGSHLFVSSVYCYGRLLPKASPIIIL